MDDRSIIIDTIDTWKQIYGIYDLASLFVNLKLLYSNDDLQR